MDKICEYEYISNDDIEALKYLQELNGRDVIKGSIKQLCRKKALTKDFIREYRDVISPEVFSTSVGLKYDLIKEFPDLFDKEAWMKYKYHSSDALESAEFMNMFSINELKEIIKDIENFFMSKETFKTLFTKEELRKDLMAKAYSFDFSKEFILNNLQYLSASSFTTSSVLNNLSTGDIEKILKSGAHDVDFVINAITSKADLSWKRRRFNEASEGKIKVNYYTGTLETLLDCKVTPANSGILSALFAFLNKYAPNAITFNIVKKALSKIDLDEDTCLVLLPYVGKYNFKKALSNYAVEQGYYSVLVALSTLVHS